MKLLNKLKGLFRSKKTSTSYLYTGTTITDKEMYGTPGWGNNSISKSITAHTGVCCGGESAVCAYKDSRGHLHETGELRDKANFTYILNDARNSYFSELLDAYTYYRHDTKDKKKLKKLIDAAQKYYDLCMDIS